MTDGKEEFKYTDESFADIQMLRYRLNGFENLSLRQKKLVYYLSKATMTGRDITTDQFGAYNLRIRKTLEAVCSQYAQWPCGDNYKALETYLKRIWFSNGIYHHYGCDKFKPGFTEPFFRELVAGTDPALLPLREGETVAHLLDELCPVIFDENVLPKRVNKSAGDDIVRTSACNYYENVSQQEVEDFYSAKRAGNGKLSYGLNSRLVKRDGKLVEETWKVGGLYSHAIQRIVYWLDKALEVAENERQRKVISLLSGYYRTGDLQTFDDYSVEWVNEKDGKIDFINGFIEVYGDPLGLKGSWEGIVEYEDSEATRRTKVISDNAQWFEDHSPVDERFRKPVVKGVSARVINAAMLGGDEYPSSAIGINLPNADWIRAQYGSKSVTIGNLTEAYNHAARGNGFREEFVVDDATREVIDSYGDQCDDLHTDLHECLGHGSGRLLPGTDSNALKAYGNTIEEARADLFGLYYLADNKLIELGLLDSAEAFHAQYYTYMMNGLLTQLVRIQPGMKIEEAHMQNRALIAWWALDIDRQKVSSGEWDSHCVELVQRSGKTYVAVNDYGRLRDIFAIELAEIQRVKSEGDYARARQLVETYAVNIDPQLHKEIRERYEHLHIAPYKGFINPWMRPVVDADGNIADISLDYTESYSHQMMRYSREYATLI